MAKGYVNLVRGGLHPVYYLNAGFWLGTCIDWKKFRGALSCGHRLLLKHVRATTIPNVPGRFEEQRY
jgi:hypothetical protein